MPNPQTPPRRDEVERAKEDLLELTYVMRNNPDYPPTADGDADAIDTLLAALSAAEGAVKREQWQPIETAPKDGAELLGMMGPKHFGLIWWFAPSSQTYGWCDVGSRRVKPTHWMPLPAPPTSSILATPGAGE